MTAEHRTRLLNAYLLIFDSFAADTSEIASALGIDNRTANALGHELGSLVVGEASETHGGFRISGQGITKSRSGDTGRFEPTIWQCWETYDYIDRDEAIAKFDQHFPTV